MKTLSILSSFLVLGTLVAHAQPAAPARSTAQVTLRATDKTVRPEREKKKDDGNEDGKKDDKPKAETVTKSLDIAVSAAKTVKGPLKIVVSWYARDTGTRKQVMAKKEDSEVTLDESQNAKAAATMEFTNTPAHSAKGADGKKEKVDASGQTFVGWVVRAYEGAVLVGETASSPTLLKLPVE